MPVEDIYSVSQQTDEIIENYGLSFFVVHYGETTRFYQGLELLATETMKYYDMLCELDTTGLLIYLESHRFLYHCLYCQKSNKLEYIQLFKTLLKWFHDHKLLQFKTTCGPYRYFKTKKPLAMLVFDTYKELGKIQYNCFTDLILDFGRYKAEQILRKRTKDNNYISYNIIDKYILRSS